MLNLPVDQVVCQDAHVQTPDGPQKVSYGDIARYALYQKNQYQIIGTGPTSPKNPRRLSPPTTPKSKSIPGPA